MIVKEAERSAAKSRRARAGAAAEKDVAYYLRRSFADRQDVFVFHDLRIEHEGENAQIDHLVLHRHGMFIIETKSVSGEIHITSSGQFIRHYGNGKRVGMESPVEQAKRQGDLLRKLLIANKADLRERKLLGMVQGGFKHCPIEVRVAISTKGIIEGEEHATEVTKADLIPGQIKQRVEAHREGGRLLNLDTSNDDGMYALTEAELERVKEFLLKQHRPAKRCASRASAEGSAGVETKTLSGRKKPAMSTPASTDAADSNTPTPAPPSDASTNDSQRPQYLCSKCQSLNLRMLYGKFGYYFKCDDCVGNTRFDTRIDGTDRKGRIRKSGQEFYLVCPETGTERLVFVNPA